MEITEQNTSFDEQEVSIGEDLQQGDESIVLDLKGLENLTFGTRWSEIDTAKRDNRRNNHRDGGKLSRRSPRRDQSFNRDSRQNNDRRSSNAKFSYNTKQKPFIPHFDVLFFQEDKSFDMLIDEMQRTCKTYEFFNVARLVLQKPERFVAAIRRRPNRDNEILPMYLSLLDDIPFDSEHEAMNYIINHHLEEFFDIHEEEIEAPKGRFTCVHRCGVTGKLLSAPNYHKYKTILIDHFNSDIRTMSFDRFVSKIETTKEEADIQEWLKQMSKKVTYSPKQLSEGETPTEVLNTIDEVKKYLLEHYRDRILREAKTLRISGVSCGQLPPSNMSRSIQYFLEKQRAFPLDTSNNLRTRLRRAGFGIYRKGKKGVSYVCAVKRKFRQEDQTFEPTTQSLVDFLELHPMIDREFLKKEYIEAENLNIEEVESALYKLIHEGYVVDYENGQLFLNPKLLKLEPETTENSDKTEDNAASADISEDITHTGTNDNPESTTSDIKSDIHTTNTHIPSVIALGKEETAIEILKDGTLSIQENKEVSLSKTDSDIAVKSTENQEE